MEDKELLDLVETCLKEEHLYFRREAEVIRSEVYSSSPLARHYYMKFIPRDDCVQVVYLLPARVTEENRSALLEYLALASSKIVRGKFTTDREMVLAEVVLDIEALHHSSDRMLDWVYGMMARNIDEYVEGMVMTALMVKPPLEAIDESEKRFAERMKKRHADDPPPAPTLDGGEKFSPALLGGDEVLDPSVFEDESILDPPPEFAVASHYTIKGLNIQGKIPLPKIITAVKKFKARKAAGKEVPRLKILLSGDPGTGKTAFAKHLASQVGLPIRAVKVSDVISKWVGETEKGIAEIFKKAKEKGEILFLDECDSFLQSRAGADHSWEVTQVNELLQQMEEFDGVMIAATNFADNLDKAVLRRFTYKLKLDYLTNEGKGIFFRKYFKTKLTAAESERLNAIAKLTPGDFRTVCEELFYLSDAPTNDERLTALEAESNAKGKDRATIGFAA